MLDSERRRQQDIQFACFDFLEISRGNLGSLGQFILSQPLRAAFAANIGTEDFQPLQFFRA
jgi:hypothetical protein